MNPQELNDPQQVSENNGTIPVEQGGLWFALKHGVRDLSLALRDVVAVVALTVSRLLSNYFKMPIQREIAVDLCIIYIFLLYKSHGFAKSKSSFYGYGAVIGFVIWMAGWMLPPHWNNSPVVPVEPPKEAAKAPPVAQRTGDATAKGEGSIANSGNGNVFVLHPQPKQPATDQKKRK